VNQHILLNKEKDYTKQMMF